MKRIFTTVLTILGALIGMGIFFTNKIMYLKKKTDEEILERETKKHFHLSDFQALPKEEIWIPSQFGYDIHGYYIPAGHSNQFMIFCHGVTVNKINSIKYANLFLKRGYNVFIYDHRRHGQSGGKTTSYGYYEKYDLKAVVDWLKTRFGTDILLGIHGESMGAATLLQYAGMIEDGADFYIADCPFSDFHEQLQHRLKVEFHLPKWPLLPLANAFLKVRDGYTIREVSPIDCIKNINNPVLFIHSKEDDYILCDMTKALYDAKNDNKQLYIAEHGAHACSYNENKQEYEYAIDQFLETYVKETKNRLA
ncbi:MULTISPECIES: alpha/beta hydrolase [Bacillus cereus group]|uniref:Alpha/beta hydrolase n=1 Tax=Bacillus cytotoxicus TaxID=580165 RepID=A0AAX2CJR9_9BACI|nr:MULTISPECIES: alpha/beta hydrolase [Bacillus cereus group]AWC29691.1 alpha/beta hydrolase [Bacillus cytotoxicus]AWC33696.1 alpha/beta hydrolase [Bacillus cytotoxicus]AWC37674.1 alpha/beta hydrolase [Bacillus cytotoxicus]AWC41822.1 alpha/beta hydrolase [Bacillus cytotoxicus]AWC49753.1 alpha/beta hydrolase [Bacillus cytotoxicus]